MLCTGLRPFSFHLILWLLYYAKECPQVTASFICDESLHSHNLPFLSVITAAGGIAEIECADSKKRRPGITSKTALFCCGSERTLYGETAAEEIGVRPIPV